MTIKAFADKYCIPYSLAFEASYEVQPKATLDRDKDFPEHELYKSLKAILKRKIERQTNELEQTKRTLADVRWRATV